MQIFANVIFNFVLGIVGRDEFVKGFDILEFRKAEIYDPAFHSPNLRKNSFGEQGAMIS